MTLLTPTPAQAAKAARNRKISADFQSLRMAYPSAPVSQIVRTLESSGKYGLKFEGLRRILRESGDIVPNRKNA